MGVELLATANRSAVEDAGEPPHWFPPPGAAPAVLAEDRTSLSREASAADVLGLYLSDRVSELCRLDPLARADVPDAVHRMRVDCRRLRSAFASFRAFLDPEVTEPLRTDLKWVIDALGGPRDLEVLRERIEKLLAVAGTSVDPSSERLVTDDLAEQHRLAHHRAVRALASPDYVALIADLQRLVADPPWSPPAELSARRELPKAVRHDWRRVCRAAAAIGGARTDDELAIRLHDVRKAAKRARYAAEAVEPAIGPDAARFARAMTALQDVLGEHHDTVVARQKVVDIATAASAGGGVGDDTFVRLLEGLADSRRVAEDDYRRTLERATRGRQLRWLRETAPRGLG